jgi:hypothetical protein
MKRELEDTLVARYPQLFKDYGGDPCKTCMAFGIETGDGWFQLIDQACQKITEVSPNAYFTQIKEKYGTLCLYLVGNDAAHDAAEWAEKQSSHVCEHCGSTQAVTTEGGWLRTLCKTCRDGN